MSATRELAWCGPVRILAAGVHGPGLEGWAAALPVLRGEVPWPGPDPAYAPPAPSSLAPAERRRAGTATRLAMVAAAQAVAAAGGPLDLEGIFASSNGDGTVVASMLESLSQTPRTVSPTQFHNSVHNAAAAYWSAGARSMAATTSLGCHDGTFAAALLRAVSAVLARSRPVLLCAYDAPLPPPLRAVRHTELPFAASLVLTPLTTAESPSAACAPFALAVRLAEGAAPGTAGVTRNASLQPLGAANPIARALPLLEALARGEPATFPMAYLEDAHLLVRVAPC